SSSSGRPGSLISLVPSSRRDTWRHREKLARDVPKKLAIGCEHQGVRGSRQDYELAVSVRQLSIEVEEIVDGCDAVVLAPKDQHGVQDLLRIDDRQVGGHVEIGAG